MNSKYKNAKQFLETCSEDEREYIYNLWYDMSVDELVDLLFDYLPADDIEAEVEDYRRETFEETD